MQAKVTQKSQYGFQVEGREGWINYGNFYKGTKEFSVDDLVEVEMNGKYVKSLKVLGASGNGEAQPEQSSGNGNGGHKSNGKSYPQESARHAGLDAAIAIVVGTAGKIDFSQAVDLVKELAPSLTSYIARGEFVVEPAKTEGK